MTNIAEYLALKGENVKVLTSSLVYSDKQQTDLKKQEVKAGVSIYRYKTIFSNKNNAYKRIVNAVWCSFRLSVALLLKSDKNDRVLAVTNPIFLVLFLPLICNLKKLSYTLLVHDVFPENLYAIKGEKVLGYNILKKIFDKAYSKAKKCITIGRDMSNVVSQKGSENIIFIPIWSQIEDVYPIKKNKSSYVKKYNLQDKFIFQFAGNLGLAQGIPNILKAILKIKREDCSFLFIGEGALERDVDLATKTNNNIVRLNYQKRENQCDFLNASDVSLVTLEQGMYGLGVPSKTYNLLAAGKPILFVGEERSEIGLLVKENNVGWVVEPNNPLKLAKTIEYIISLPISVHQKIGNKARELAETKYAKKLVLEKYYKLLKDE